MPRRTARPGLALLAVLTLLSGSAVVRPAGTEAAATLAPLGPGQFRQGLAREVFGYLPYWEVDSTVDAYLRYDLLTTIAFFSLTYRRDGTIDTGTSGYLRYTGATADTIIAHAHAAGVRVVPTIQAFNTTGQTALLRDMTAQTVAIQQTVDLMRLRGADGVNVDIEAMPSSLLSAYGTFIANLRAAVLAWNPYAEVSVATGAGSFGAQMAATAIASGADRIFAMGYDYHWSGSTYSGAVAPYGSLGSTLTTYANAGVPANRTILGLPYYGRTWPTTTSELNAPVQTDTATYGGSSAFFPDTLPGSASGWTVLRDDPQLSVRMTKFDATRNTWLQTYYDDPGTLAPKVALANGRGLAGIGMWALGYDRGQPGFWEMIANAFGAPRITRMSLSDAGDVSADTSAWLTPPALPPAGTTRSRNVILAIGWTEGTYPATEIRLSNDGVSWSAWLPLAPNVGWTIAEGPDGSRTVRAQLRAGGDGGPVSKAASTRVVLDRVDPPVSGPSALPILRSTLALTDGTALVAARLAWSATDGTTQVVGQALEGTTDGTTWTFAGTPAATARSAIAAIPVGRTVRFRLEAADTVGWVGGPIAGPAYRFALVDDRASAVVRSSGWTRSASSSGWAGTTTWTIAAGRTISYRFTGSAISVLAPVGPTRGSVRVSLDGVAVGTFSEYATTNGARRIVYVRAVAPGTHTITLVTVGTSGRPRVDLDAFIVLR